MENKLSEILGARLLSISTVQEKTGISRKTLTGLYYRRAKNVKLDTLQKLCDYLQIPLSDLIEYTPKELVKGA
ncbi:MAG TPA: helix-turn-helix transcriptional regulator [Candidatus Levilactobacillus faecigallinarum]|uniref:Helix-turn-helix transcriptional regulator n=1 Tax=Candidatus Levilactobacillus faecigallinarum TaxID=2838638 RepID=A0A9D1U534_9LACO|nr:helix-turn-helix transcriptional regulator [Candidatus Levilactobacillus faecigallinarum]